MCTKDYYKKLNIFDDSAYKPTARNLTTYWATTTKSNIFKTNLNQDRKYGSHPGKIQPGAPKTTNRQNQQTKWSWGQLSVLSTRPHRNWKIYSQHFLTTTVSITFQHYRYAYTHYYEYAKQRLEIAIVFVIGRYTNYSRIIRNRF